MNNHDNSHQFNSQQFVVSYELLCLLRWLLENDLPKFKKIISKALAAGLKDEIKHLDQLQDVHVDPALMQEVQYSIIEFFNMLETILLEALKEDSSQRSIQKKLMNTIDHIDGSICNDALVRSSLEKASAKSEQSPKENEHELLYKELLKQWKPTKNMMN